MITLRPTGYYDEQGKSQCGEPALRDIISGTPDAEEAKIIGYLRDGIGVAGCGGVGIDILNPERELYLNLDVYSDGVWHWPAYLVYYVEKYHARVSEQFVAHMRANSWAIPKNFDRNTEVKFG